MTVEQAMLRVGVDLYFVIVDHGETIEEGTYEEVCETMDYPVNLIEILGVDAPEDMMCLIYV